MPRVVVIGAGAAGTMAAIFAASAGAETLLLERTKEGGRKILISGGGRCNILPARVDESRFVTDSSPHTLRRIVRSWPLHAQIAFFESDLGLPLMEERESAKLFPKSQSSRDVRDKLFAFARSKGVTIVGDTLVLLFNADQEPVTFVLPATTPEERWETLIDTADPWLPPKRLRAGDRYQLHSRSMALLRLNCRREDRRRSADWGPMGVY